MFMIDWNKHLHRINGSYLNTPHGLSFEGYRVRKILTRICVSSECFGEAIYFVDKKQPVSPEHSGLHQTKYGG